MEFDTRARADKVFAAIRAARNAEVPEGLIDGEPGEFAVIENPFSPGFFSILAKNFSFGDFERVIMLTIEEIEDEVDTEIFDSILSE